MIPQEPTEPSRDKGFVDEITLHLERIRLIREVLQSPGEYLWGPRDSTLATTVDRWLEELGELLRSL